MNKPTKEQIARWLESEKTTPGCGPRVRCNHCNDVIQSTHRHDFVWCSCKAIAVDGGSSYLRMSFQHPDDFTVLDEHADETS